MQSQAREAASREKGPGTARKGSGLTVNGRTCQLLQLGRHWVDVMHLFPLPTEWMDGRWAEPSIFSQVGLLFLVRRLVARFLCLLAQLLCLHLRQLGFRLLGELAHLLHLRLHQLDVIPGGYRGLICSCQKRTFVLSATARTEVTHEGLKLELGPRVVTFLTLWLLS